LSIFKYLGIPIALKNPSSQSWSKIIDKIKTKFGQWGSQWLNPVDRVVLIKSVLSALSIYQCSSMLFHVGIMNQINLNIREFIWQGGKTNTQKNSILAIGKLLTSKGQGWLGNKRFNLDELGNVSQIAMENYYMHIRLVEKDFVEKILQGEKKWVH
jgi:hypothetical protein